MPTAAVEDDVTWSVVDVLAPGAAVSDGEPNTARQPAGTAEVRLNDDAGQAELSVLASVRV